MNIVFAKYHALQNDFIVIDTTEQRIAKGQLSTLTLAICNRHTGVGADGVLFLEKSKQADNKVDVYNADGSWAEKSGNGLRIAAVHKYLQNKKRKRYNFEIADAIDEAVIKSAKQNKYIVSVLLGEPVFETAFIPVKTEQKYMIQSPLKIGRRNFPVTCLAVGNPHTVLFVDNFDFEWQALGDEIEHHHSFPERTNVEFVKIVNRNKIKVAEWERGAGATGSSGTGAAAAVCAAVFLGRVNRECEVVFETGSLFVSWSEKTNNITLTGPVTRICNGVFNFQ